MGMMQPWISRGIGTTGVWEAGEFSNGFQKVDGQMLQHVPMIKNIKQLETSGCGFGKMAGLCLGR